MAEILKGTESLDGDLENKKNEQSAQKAFEKAGIAGIAGMTDYLLSQKKNSKISDGQKAFEKGGVFGVIDYYSGLSSREALDSEKNQKKFDTWKYADLNKANFIRKKFPDIKATDQEVENAAYSVYWDKKNGFTNLEAARKNPVYHNLIKLAILAGRNKKFDAWKYADLNKANFIRKKFPDIKATDQEVENAAYSVYWDKTNGFTNLEAARKNPVYHKLIKLAILESRQKKQLAA